jgi:ketosteroid isomerase-like protein
MMRRIAVFAMLIALPFSAKAQDETAKTLAQDILDKGSALFDRHDAAAMAATYTEDAQLFWLQKDDSTGEVKVTNKNGRAEIEDLYRDIFKDPGEKTTSKNTVEFARFAKPDVLIVEGVFQPNVDKQGKFPFVQVRVKQGNKWLMKTLQFFVMSQD